MQNRLRCGYLYQKKIIVFFLYLIDLFLKAIPRPRREIPQDPKRVLLVKPDHLGDFLLMSSILPLLRERYPDTSFDLLTGPWNKELARDTYFFENIYTLNHPMHNRQKEPFIKKLVHYHHIFVFYHTIPRLKITSFISYGIRYFIINRFQFLKSCFSVFHMKQPFLLKSIKYRKII